MTTDGQQHPARWVPSWGFSDRLRKIRTGAGWSQRQCAAILNAHLEAIDARDINGVPVRTPAGSIGAWESGRHVPLSDRATIIARALEVVTGVPAEWTLGVRERAAYERYGVRERVPTRPPSQRQATEEAGEEDPRRAATRAAFRAAVPRVSDDRDPALFP